MKIETNRVVIKINIVAISGYLVAGMALLSADLKFAISTALLASIHQLVAGKDERRR